MICENASSAIGVCSGQVMYAMIANMYESVFTVFEKKNIHMYLLRYLWCNNKWEFQCLNVYLLCKSFYLLYNECKMIIDL